MTHEITAHVSLKSVQGKGPLYKCAICAAGISGRRVEKDKHAPPNRIG